MGNALLHKIRWPLSYSMQEIVLKNEVDKVNRSGLAPGLDWSPSKEYRFHAEIYAARKDVNAIVHCHPPHATAYAVRKLDIPCVTDAAFKQPPMPHVSFSPSGSEELARKVSAAAQADDSFRVIMLDEHGIVAVGTDLMQAFVFADLAEEMAQIAFLSSSLAEKETRNNAAPLAR